MQEEKKPISDITVINFLKEKKANFNEMEVLVLISCLWCTFDTMTKYMKILKELEEEQKLRELRNGR